MQNVEQTVNGDYLSSQTMMGIITAFNDAIDPTVDVEAIRANILDIDTAQGFGLDILGRIIGLSREVRGVSSSAIAGLAIAGSAIAGNLSLTSGAVTSLNDVQYRVALKIKAFGNVSRLTVDTMNAQLRMLSLGRGNAWVHDFGGMSFSYYFGFALQSFERSMIINSDLLMRPSCVTAALVESPNTLSIAGLAIAGLTKAGT